eukprot:GILJ01010863.1.p1 GENE.GILJ01010863.1~~GILJ01010863.1.p1  ORF type:complete len:421 (-),score=45.56 GILJ01010863.1:259-1380(-)
MTEADLLGLFAPYGEVESCKLIMDNSTGNSKGFGFVKFTSQLNANQAIHALNGLHIQNKQLKVSIARPSTTDIKNANLYISGLPTTYTTRDLEQLFAQYGGIINSKLLTDPSSGESKGVGFVRFNTHTEAQRAMEWLTGTLLPGASGPLNVKFADSSNDRHHFSRGPMGGMMVGQVPSAMFFPNSNPYGGGGMRSGTRRNKTNGRNYAYPQTTPGGYYGEIDNMPDSVYVSMSTNGHTPGHSHSQQPQGMPFGQPQVPSPHGLMPSQDSSFGVVPMSPTGPSPSAPSSNGWCMFVYNLPGGADDTLLYQLFAPFGAVLNVSVIRDVKTGLPKGYGFVNMLNFEEARAAIVGLNGAQIGDRHLQVSFKTEKKKF